jgi:hypothetical protein
MKIVFVWASAIAAAALVAFSLIGGLFYFFTADETAARLKKLEDKTGAQK